MAPALHSLTTYNEDIVADILEFLVHKHIDLRKLIIKNCWLGERIPGILANFVDLYQDLEGLSLEGCTSFVSGVFCPIARLKKLSELNLSFCEVQYMCLKLLETHVCICEACRSTPLEIYFMY